MLAPTESIRAMGIGAAAAGDVSGTITDSSSGQPLPSAEISVMQGSQVVTNTQTDAFGRYTVHSLNAG